MLNRKFRLSRLHNEKGNHVGLIKLIYFFPALFSRILKFFNYHPEIPIINYDAIVIFKNIAKIKPSVLEYGSGFSSIWWSKRANKIVTVESDKFWYQKIRSKLDDLNKADIHISYVTAMEKYVSVGKNQLFDLIIIDGLYRGQCLEYALKHNTHKDTIIYLDDSDKESSFEIKNKRGDCRDADILLQEYCFRNNMYLHRTNNFSPTHVFVKEGCFVVSKNKKFKDILNLD